MDALCEMSGGRLGMQLVMPAGQARHECMSASSIFHHLGIFQDWQHMLLEAGCLSRDKLLQSKTGRVQQAAWTQSPQPSGPQLALLSDDQQRRDPGAYLPLL